MSSSVCCEVPCLFRACRERRPPVDKVLRQRLSFVALLSAGQGTSCSARVRRLRFATPSLPGCSVWELVRCEPVPTVSLPRARSSVPVALGLEAGVSLRGFCFKRVARSLYSLCVLALCPEKGPVAFGWHTICLFARFCLFTQTGDVVE